jgi:hypothetical protein
MTASGPVVLGAAAVPVSLTVLSPLQQGDALCGLVLAVAGVGPAAPAGLPSAEWPIDVGAGDAWGVTLGSDTGWYVLLSQDCDVVRGAGDEPTVLVAPLTLVDDEDWNSLVRNGYSARVWPYPAEKFPGVPAGKALVVDLAWTTSILKGSLASDTVRAQRPLTGPNRRAFAEWLAGRTGRVPFDDDVVTKVLDPCYDVRTRAAKQLASKGTSAPLDARALGTVVRWYAKVDGRTVDVLGETSGPLLHAAGMVTPDGTVNAADLEKGRLRLEQAMVRRMATVDSQSGYQLRLTIADLNRVTAASFRSFALLVR